ncbi:DUF3152 domain-containing protein [Streptomyces sp. NPDC005438]|uniref:DUF3152 domain-containing protein n=1 Tax=Streptomyces sp. NPDC005438 TaxID=3156880 RepID=UPI0033BDEB8B
MGAPLVGQQSGGGPRQEYLDAFDDSRFGTGSTSWTDPDEDVFAKGAPDSRVPGPRGAEPPPDDPDEEPADTPAPQPEPKVLDTGQRGRRSRAFTGVAAAAVTTVLLMVVAGQVTGLNGSDKRDDGPLAGPTRADRGEAGEASRSRGRPKGPPQLPADNPKADYQDRMATQFALDPDSTGTGKFRAVAGHQKAPGSGPVLRYRVDVEGGVPLNGELFAKAVHKTLNDKRSWAHGGAHAFERVSKGRADFVITLASPAGTATWCAKSGLDTTQDNVSCDSASTERVMINGYRWAQGAPTFGKARMHAYRQMLINHEVGHRLGYGHESCPKDGALAPVMMQQTKFLRTGDRNCRPNAWPHP